MEITINSGARIAIREGAQSAVNAVRWPISAYAAQPISVPSAHPLTVTGAPPVETLSHLVEGCYLVQGTTVFMGRGKGATDAKFSTRSGLKSWSPPV